MQKDGFCRNGHDLSVLGRYASGGCKVCQRAATAKSRRELSEGRLPTKRGTGLKQFCLRGHDTFACGRSEGGMCIECRKAYKRGKPTPRVRRDGKYCSACFGYAWRRPPEGKCRCGGVYEEERKRA